jgi:hypothetical protein
MLVLIERHLLADSMSVLIDRHLLAFNPGL